MTVLERIPFRFRLALIFSLGTAVVLVVLASFVYKQVSDDLLATIDTGLLSRAELIEKAINEQQAGVVNDGSNLIDSDEAFAQVLDSSGQLVDSSSAVSGAPLVTPTQLHAQNSSRFLIESIPNIDFPSRLLVDPQTVRGSTFYVIVGTKLADRQDALNSLLAWLSAGGALALLMMSFAGWLLAGAALRPVERMRKDAAAISLMEPDRRLRIPMADDELARLARTLNELLDRMSRLLNQERTFLDQASHELRTPLGVLKAELDLATSRPRQKAELQETVRKASMETDRLIRLSRDLLVLARMRDGRLPVSRRPISLHSLVEDTRLAWSSRVRAAGLQMQVTAPERTVWIDVDRVRQALDNLLDNAIKHSDRGAPLVLTAEVLDGHVSIAVENAGESFPGWLLPRAFEPFVVGPDSEGAGAGLGLAIVRAVAVAHGGHAVAENLSGSGARVAITLATEEAVARV